VDIAIDEISRLAVDLLLRRISEGDACKPVTYTLSTALIRRASSGARATKIERVAAG
jgi:DNA-binding LacI/PurR family transcriptional regulator